MSDKGHELTDEMIEELEKRLEKEYSRAYKDVARKAKAYFDKFKADDAAMKARVDAGEITREYWLQWRYNHMMTGKRWIEMRDTLAEDLMKVDSKARSIINEHTPEAYALNHNYATFQVEKDSMLNTSYTLYNREAVENILRDDPKLLPYPRTESKTARELRERADLIWNRQKLNNEITQGILQGEPIKDIAKRLQKVVGMDGRAALRNARTMMTAAENKGREDAYDALEKKGVELDRHWVATLDDKTRHSHRLLHGEIKDRKTGLYSNGLRYPSDPDGDPAEVYNCRCSEIATVKGFPIDIPKYSPKMGDMTYEEWLGEHAEKVAPKATERYDFSAMFKKTKGITEEFAEKMGETARNCKYEMAQDVYAKFADRLVCEDDKSDRAYCTGTRIYFNAEVDAKGSFWQTPTQVAFHEFGHNIDRLILNDSMNKGVYHDWTEWGISNSEHNGRTLMSALKEDMKNIKAMYNASTADEAISYIAREGYSQKQRCDLSDVLERFSSTSYPLGFGHGKNYHKRKGSTENEFFAEVLDSAMANTEAYETTLKYFPKGIEWVWDVIRSVLND